ncbi:MAG: F0F1 ATP synthase subunit B [bacterium]|nr:F0F1 ATP synthase subunit B [bacterium]
MIRFSLPTFIFQTINFLVTLYLIYRFVYKPLANYISKRQETIRSELEQARIEREKAEALRLEYEEKLKEAHKRAENIIEEAKSQAELERAQIIDRANREAQALLTRAQNELLLERNHAIEKFKEEVVDLIMNLTTKLIIAEFNNKDEFKEKILEEYIERVRSN